MYQDATIPAIVSEQLWDEAAQLRKACRDKYHREVLTPCNHGIYRYSGKIESGLVPGAHYSRTVYRYKNTEREAWQCRSRKDPQHPENIGPTVYTDELDAIVRDMLYRIIGSYEDIINGLLARYRSTADNLQAEKQRAALGAETERIAGRQKKLLELYEDGVLSKAAFLERNREHQMRLDAISLEIASTAHAEENTQSLLAELDGLREIIAETAKKMQPGRETIDTLIEKIIICPESTKKALSIAIVLKATGVKQTFCVQRKSASRKNSCNCGNIDN